MSSVAVYSAMTVYIMLDAELHTFNKFAVLNKGINCPKIQTEANFSEGIPASTKKEAQIVLRLDMIASFTLILKVIITRSI